MLTKTTPEANRNVEVVPGSQGTNPKENTPKKQIAMLKLCQTMWELPRLQSEGKWPEKQIVTLELFQAVWERSPHTLCKIAARDGINKRDFFITFEFGHSMLSDTERQNSAYTTSFVWVSRDYIFLFWHNAIWKCCTMWITLDGGIPTLWKHSRVSLFHRGPPKLWSASWFALQLLWLP